MLQVGSLVINLNAIAYLDLEAKQNYVTNKNKETPTGVRVYLNALNGQGYLESLFFKGEEAEYLRTYFTSVACGVHVYSRYWRSKMLARGSSLPKHLTVELEEFLNCWEVNHTELTQICECNISTVRKWFLDKENADYCPPTQHHKQLLAQAHYLWRTEARKERSCRLRRMYWEKHYVCDE
ncbi:MAG: hypothetical protein RM021_016440 [Nostoc sp. EkiNYC01]|nr:hypothetical protein [Nostoc sp. EkiNYC01]